MKALIALILVELFLASTVSAQAQPGPAQSTSDQCAAAAQQGASTLESERRKAELNLAMFEKEHTAKARSDGDQKGQAQNLPIQDFDIKIRDTREELLELLFKIDCLRADLAPDPTIGPSGSRAASLPLVEITEYYATNRAQTQGNDPYALYTGDPAELQYGRAVVTIPFTHEPGTLELPSLWKFERRPDPGKHFILKSVTPLGPAAGLQELSEELNKSKSKTLLVFVHGYNVSFSDAALRTAQLAHDLRFPGLVMFFSWPSAARARSYWRDEEVAQLSEPVFANLLGQLSSLSFADIYVVAHSMGNRIAGNAIQSLADRGSDLDRVRALLLAAPDINAEIFRRIVAPKLAKLQRTRTTIYASSSDIALKASKIVHEFPRVGETDRGVLTFPGMETVDASASAPMSRSFGHSYVVDSVEVLADIRKILYRNIDAQQRGLSPLGTAPGIYWRLQ
jgi:esterase/lipase superfamily enzyme